LKNSLSTKTVEVFIALFILTACNGPLPRQTIPTAASSPTIQPAIAPTSTISPTSTPLLLGEYELLSPEDMRHDLDELFYQIEHVHPNPYTRRSKSDVDRERQRIYRELGEPITLIDFYRKVDPLVSSLGDFHTYILLPKKVMEIFEKNELLLPLDFGFDGQKVLITANYSGNPGIPIRAQVLSINSIPINKIHALTTSFPSFSFWLDYGSFAEYHVEILRAGETKPVILTIPGMTWDQIQQRFTSPKLNKPVLYKKIPDEPIGVLTINTFIGIGPSLKPAFTQIKEENFRHLIIDVRVNPGGRDISPLMDYLTDQSYRLSSRSYKAPFSGYGTEAPREAECEVIEPFDTKERFRGTINLLIGPNSFSAAIIFGNILQDYRLDTLLGEETRDTASFCASPVESVLPRTKLLYEISTVCYVRPSGVLDDRPLIPDIPVETTIQDQISGKDPVMDYTLKMIRNNRQMP
jgi:hypothetical protein